MCGSMVDIQSPTAEIRRGNKKRRRRRNHSMKIYMACPITQGSHKKPQGKNIMSASDTQGSDICKSSAVAEMGNRGHNRHGPKRGRGAAVPISWSWDPI